MLYCVIVSTILCTAAAAQVSLCFVILNLYKRQPSFCSGLKYSTHIVAIVDNIILFGNVMVNRYSELSRQNKTHVQAQLQYILNSYNRYTYNIQYNRYSGDSLVQLSLCICHYPNLQKTKANVHSTTHCSQCRNILNSYGIQFSCAM